MFLKSKHRLAILKKNLNLLKIFNYIGLKLAYKFQLRTNPFLPSTIDIEPINICNFKCSHCQVTISGKERFELNIKSFNKIIQQFPRLMKVKLQGMGEPFLNKELLNLIKSGEKQGVTMCVITNGSLCAKKASHDLLKLENSYIIFSIDGATSQVFEKIRNGSDFEKIRNNISYLTHKREIIREGGRSNLLIGAWSLVNSENVKQLSQLVILASELKLDYITFLLCITDWGKKQMKKDIDKIQILKPNDLVIAINQAKKTAEKLNLPLIISEDIKFSNKRVCPWSWTSTFIAANGDVVPCCIIADSEIVKMGNVFEKDFKTIWNSSSYKKFREQHIKGNIPDYCKGCYTNK